MDQEEQLDRAIRMKRLESGLRKAWWIIGCLATLLLLSNAALCLGLMWSLSTSRTVGILSVEGIRLVDSSGQERGTLEVTAEGEARLVFHADASRSGTKISMGAMVRDGKPVAGLDLLAGRGSAKLLASDGDGAGFSLRSQDSRLGMVTVADQVRIEGAGPDGATFCMSAAPHDVECWVKVGDSASTMRVKDKKAGVSATARESVAGLLAEDNVGGEMQLMDTHGRMRAHAFAAEKVSGEVGGSFVTLDNTGKVEWASVRPGR